MRVPTELPWMTYLLAAWVLLTALFTALAPSASEGLSVGSRALFWAVHLGVPILLLQVAQIAVSRYALRLSDWANVTMSGFLGALAFVPVAWGLDALFPEDGDAPQTINDAIASEAISTVVPVMLVWIALNGPRLLRISQSVGNGTTAIATKEPTFWIKVPRDIGRDLVSISAELHYLRVRTTQGDALILYPFGKAVEELVSLSGQQVHRSHWVAMAHVTDILRRGDGATVHLKHGPPLPVSRRFRKPFMQAWEDAFAFRADNSAAGA